MYSAGIDERKNKIIELENIRTVDAFIVFDELLTVIHKFTRDYVQGIDLHAFLDRESNLKLAVNATDSMIKNVLLAEKGIIFFYHFNTLSLLILAAYRESTDIFELQLKLDTIVKDLKV